MRLNIFVVLIFANAHMWSGSDFTSVNFRINWSLLALMLIVSKHRFYMQTVAWLAESFSASIFWGRVSLCFSGLSRLASNPQRDLPASASHEHGPRKCAALPRKCAALPGLAHWVFGMLLVCWLEIHLRRGKEDHTAMASLSPWD